MWGYAKIVSPRRRESKRSGKKTPRTEARGGSYVKDPSLRLFVRQRRLVLIPRRFLLCRVLFRAFRALFRALFGGGGLHRGEELAGFLVAVVGGVEELDLVLYGGLSSMAAAFS